VAPAPERKVGLVKQFGPERLIVDSDCDWGISDPLSVPKTGRLMAEQGIAADAIRLVTYANALAVYGQSGQIEEQDWLSPAPIDRRTLYRATRCCAAARARRSTRIELSPRADCACPKSVQKPASNFPAL
jgi:hypothetical protein